MNFSLEFSGEKQMHAYSILCRSLSLVEKYCETWPMDHFLLKVLEFQYSFEQFVAIDIQNKGILTWKLIYIIGTVQWGLIPIIYLVIKIYKNRADGKEIVRSHKEASMTKEILDVCCMFIWLSINKPALCTNIS